MAPKRTFSLPRHCHLTLSKDFEYLRSNSSKVRVGSVIVYFKESRIKRDTSRIAFSISKKVGSSVYRHRFKRMGKEIFRLDSDLRSKYLDMLVVVTVTIDEQSYKRSLLEAFSRIKTAKSPP